MSDKPSTADGQHVYCLSEKEVCNLICSLLSFLSAFLVLVAVLILFAGCARPPRHHAACVMPPASYVPQGDASPTPGSTGAIWCSSQQPPVDCCRQRKVEK